MNESNVLKSKSIVLLHLGLVSPPKHSNLNFAVSIHSVNFANSIQEQAFIA